MLKDIKRTCPYSILLLLVILIRISLSFRLPPVINGNLIHDDLWMVDKAWNILNTGWLGAYNQYTLIKGCFSPLLLAFSYKIGLPFLCFNTVLYVLSCCLFVYSLRPVLKTSLSRLLTITILLFNPISMASETYQRIYRNGILLWLIPMLFGCIFYIYQNSTKYKNIFLMSLLEGVCIWAVLNVREDTVWVIPLSITAVLVTILTTFFKCKKNNEKSVLRIVAKCLAFVTPFLFCFMLNSFVLGMNKHCYGYAALNDRTKGYFSKVVNDLYKIDVIPVSDKDVVITRDVFNKAFLFSPTLKKAKNQINEALDVWGGGKNEEVRWDHPFFAMRDGVASAGYYKSLYTSEQFYKDVHEELSLAFRTRALSKKKALLVTTAGVLTKKNIAPIIKDYINSFKLLCSFDGVAAVMGGATGEKANIARFGALTGSSYINDMDFKSISGWMVKKYGTMDFLFRNAESSEAIKVKFEHSPDIYNYFLSSTGESIQNAKNARFFMSIPLGFNNIDIVDSSGVVVANVNSDKTCSSFSDDFFVCIDNISNNFFSDKIYTNFINRVNKLVYVYKSIIKYLLVLSFSFYVYIFISLFLRIRARQFECDAIDLFISIAQLSLFLTFSLFIGMISYVSEGAFYAFRPLYMVPAYSFFSLYIVIAIGVMSEKIIMSVKDHIFLRMRLKKNIISEYIFFAILCIIVFFTSFLRLNKKLEDCTAHNILKMKVHKVKTNEWNKGLVIDLCNGRALNSGKISVFDDDDSIEISGWAIDIDNKTSLSGIYAVIGEYIIKGSYGIPRPDVQSAVGINSEAVGFSFLIPKELIKIDSDVCFYLVPRDSTFVYEPHRYVVDFIGKTYMDSLFDFAEDISEVNRK